MTARIGPPDFGAVDAFPREYHPDGFQYDPQIERDRGMIDIPEVKRQLVLAAEAGITVHLRPARQPRPHQSAPDAVGTHVIDGVGKERARPDKAHVALHDVPQFGEFIDPAAPQEAAKTGQPLLVRRSEEHTSELQSLMRI